MVETCKPFQVLPSISEHQVGSWETEEHQAGLLGAGNWVLAAEHCGAVDGEEQYLSPAQGQAQEPVSLWVYFPQCQLSAAKRGPRSIKWKIPEVNNSYFLCVFVMLETDLGALCMLGRLHY